MYDILCTKHILKISQTTRKYNSLPSVLFCAIFTTCQLPNKQVNVSNIYCQIGFEKGEHCFQDLMELFWMNVSH